MDPIIKQSHKTQKVIGSIGNYKPELDVTDELGLVLLSSYIQLMGICR